MLKPHNALAFPLFFSIALTTLFPKEAAATSCLQKHLRDAIKINQQRKPLYSKLSQGRSEAISNKLIQSEYRVLAIAPIVDLWAKPYQLAGVPIVCEDLIDMKFAPPFRSKTTKEFLQNFKPAPIAAIQENLATLYKNKDYVKMALFADEHIRILDQYPLFNCMTKHVLESIRRIAALANKHNEAAQQKIKNKLSGALKNPFEKSHKAAENIQRVRPNGSSSPG